jgi:hypothetical protein
MEQASLTKHRTLLQMRVEDLENQRVSFEQEDIEGARTIKSFVMDRLIWLDMGRPFTITITVEPGDLLNAED